jgi:hypothetical protein
VSPGSRLGRPVVALLLMSVLDGALTQWEVTQGWATEANPVLDWALSTGGWPGFWALKLSLLGLGCLTFVRMGERSRLAGPTLGALLVLHVGVLALHAAGLWHTLTC